MTVRNGWAIVVGGRLRLETVAATRDEAFEAAARLELGQRSGFRLERTAVRVRVSVVGR